MNVLIVPYLVSTSQDSPSETINIRYSNMESKLKHLRRSKYEVIVVWKCDLRIMFIEKITSYTENHLLLINIPINLRGDLFGGRTSNTMEYYKLKEVEKLR